MTADGGPALTRRERPGGASRPGWDLLLDVAWAGQPPATPSDDDLAAALALAVPNEVAPALVRAYPDRLPRELRELDRSVGRFRANLAEASGRLERAGVTAVLIKAMPTEDYTYSNFDVVVGDDGWDAAVAALGDWVTRTSAHPLERTKLLMYPADGPAVHLHRSVAWFDIPIVPTDDLRRRASRPDGSPVLLPDAADTLRIALAHAAFQNLSLTLGELRLYRDLVAAGHRTAAAERARDEGWPRGFAMVDRAARGLARALDERREVPLPASLPVAGSALAGVEHALHLARTGRVVSAAREVALRGPLIAAKRRTTARASRPARR